MLYGITGPSRSGKTTLARKIAEDLGIDFYETSTTKVARELGYDPCAPMSLKDRALLQFGLLDNHIEMIDQLPRPLVTDRTPLDMLAYMLAEFSMQSHLLVQPDTLRAVDRFTELCLEATRTRYDMLFFLAPLEEYKIDPTKAQPPENPAYQKHFSLLVQGALASLHGEINYVVIDDTSFDFRQSYVHDAIVERMDEIDKMRKAAPFH